MQTSYFRIDSADLLPCKPAIPAEYKALNTYSIDNINGQISLQINTIPEKKSSDEQRWLAIQSTTNPDSTFLVSFVRDQVNRPRVVHINSLQLSSMKQKNIWLCTQKANGEGETAYLGSIK
jgi:hypothetical protein